MQIDRARMQTQAARSCGCPSLALDDAPCHPLPPATHLHPYTPDHLTANPSVPLAAFSDRYCGPWCRFAVRRPPCCHTGSPPICCTGSRCLQCRSSLVALPFASVCVVHLVLCVPAACWWGSTSLHPRLFFQCRRWLCSSLRPCYMQLSSALPMARRLLRLSTASAPHLWVVLQHVAMNCDHFSIL
jgi:hypothetical protein